MSNETIQRLEQRIADIAETREQLHKANIVISRGGTLEEVVALGISEPAAIALMKPGSLDNNSLMISISRKTENGLRYQLEKAKAKAAELNQKYGRS